MGLISEASEALDLRFERASLPANAFEVLVAEVRKALTGEGESEEVIQATIKAEVALMKREIIWLSGTHQVNIRVIERGPIHYSLKRRDKDAILDRDVMVKIAHHFNRSKAQICTELYPADSRMVDTANQYHIWAVNKPRDFDLSKAQEALENPEKPIPLPYGHALIHLPLGASRDWREAMKWKREALGPEIECADLLVPGSLGRGPVMFVAPVGVSLPWGWGRGLIMRESGVKSRQRPFQERAEGAPNEFLR